MSKLSKDLINEVIRRLESQSFNGDTHYECQLLRAVLKMDEVTA